MPPRPEQSCLPEKPRWQRLNRRGGQCNGERKREDRLRDEYDLLGPDQLDRSEWRAREKEDVEEHPDHHGWERQARVRERMRDAPAAEASQSDRKPDRYSEHR